MSRTGLVAGLLIAGAIAGNALAQPAAPPRAVPSPPPWRALEERRFAEAVELFEAAARLAPRDASLRFGAGVANLMQGKNADARRGFEAALAIDPRLIDASVLLGLALLPRRPAAGRDQGVRERPSLRARRHATHRAAGAVAEGGVHGGPVLSGPGRPLYGLLRGARRRRRRAACARDPGGRLLAHRARAGSLSAAPAVGRALHHGTVSRRDPVARMGVRRLRRAHQGADRRRDRVRRRAAARAGARAGARDGGFGRRSDACRPG